MSWKKSPKSEMLLRSTSTGSRLFAIDVLRGLIMALMALDHANLLIAQQHPPGEYWGGTLPIYDGALPFMTRLVTHLCAPGFFFLMGTGMALLAHARQRQGWNRWAITRHFWLRGLLLIALQLLIVNRAWELSPAGWGIEIYIGVLFCLGGAMIVGGMLWPLAPPYLIGLTIVLLIGTELLVPPSGQWGMGKSALELILLTPGGRQMSICGGMMWVNYPLLPWLELVVFGLAFGRWLSEHPRRAFIRGRTIGAACLIAFVAIRFSGGFGNIRPQMDDTWIGFLNLTKYPPSIAYTLLTMGINLILLWAFSQVDIGGKKILQVVAMYGRAPLLFYLAHLFLYIGMAYALVPHGTSLVAMYPLWLLGLLILYPLCSWYGRLKQRQLACWVLRFL